MKNILIVIESLQGGGAEKVLLDILNNISNKKYNIDLLLINKTGIYLEEIQKKYRVRYLMKDIVDLEDELVIRKIKSFIRILKIKFMTSYIMSNLFKPDKYDIEIAFLEGVSTKFVSNRNNKSKKIAWVHTDLKKNRRLTKKTELKVYKNMDKIICVSNDSANSFKELYPIYSNKVEMIYNPINIEVIRKLSKINENKIIKIHHITNFITIGRLEKVKGYDILLKAHKQLIEEGYNHNIYVLGQGKEYKNLKLYIDNNNLSNSVYLLGFKENPYPYLNEADVFISSSRYEGLSLVVCESMILGKPIIATNCTGPRELLNDGEFGILAKIESVESLKSAMKEMIVSEQKRKYYSEKALERSKIFDLKETISKIEYLFDNI